MSDDLKIPHDALFKWLISAFIEDFFAHYFPTISIRSFEFIDKEFIQKYEALKDSLEGDLFLLILAQIEDEWQEIVIQFEHQSKREDMGLRCFEYFCYSWLLRKFPVWSIVFYTDEAVWRKPVSDKFWYGFNSQDGKQNFRFDVIKLKAEKSEDLIKHHSLLCKLLALKANDRQCDREALVKEILATVESMKEQLPNDKITLIHEFIQYYHKLPVIRYKQIKKEVQMPYVPATFGEFIKETVQTRVDEELRKKDEEVRKREEETRKKLQEEVRKREEETRKREEEAHKRKEAQKKALKGELIGEIRFAQRILKQTENTKKELMKCSMKKLKTILKQLETQLQLA